MFYTPLSERSTTMSSVAERANAHKVKLAAKQMPIRGYDFVPSMVDESEKEFIFRSLFPIGLDAFVQNPSEGMEKDIRDHLFSAEHLLVMRSDGTFKFGGNCEIGQPRPIAFRMWKNYNINGKKALYLAGMCVSPSWQGRRIGQKMTEYAIEMEKPDYVFTVTQNPIAKLSMDKTLGKESFPKYEYERFDYTPFAEALGKKADRYGKIAGNYGASLYGILPISRDERYNEVFLRLNREAGDAYLCVSEL